MSSSASEFKLTGDKSILMPAKETPSASDEKKSSQPSPLATFNMFSSQLRISEQPKLSNAGILFLSPRNADVTEPGNLEIMVAHLKTKCNVRIFPVTAKQQKISLKGDLVILGGIAALKKELHESKDAKVDIDKLTTEIEKLKTTTPSNQDINTPEVIYSKIDDLEKEIFTDKLLPLIMDEGETTFILKGTAPSLDKATQKNIVFISDTLDFYLKLAEYQAKNSKANFIFPIEKTDEIIATSLTSKKELDENFSKNKKNSKKFKKILEDSALKRTRTSIGNAFNIRAQTKPLTELSEEIVKSLFYRRDIIPYFAKKESKESDFFTPADKIDEIKLEILRRYKKAKDNRENVIKEIKRFLSKTYKKSFKIPENEKIESVVNQFVDNFLKEIEDAKEILRGHVNAFFETIKGKMENSSEVYFSAEASEINLLRMVAPFYYPGAQDIYEELRDLCVPPALFDALFPVEDLDPVLEKARTFSFLPAVSDSSSHPSLSSSSTR